MAALRRMPRRARRAAQGRDADEPRGTRRRDPRRPTSSARSTSCGRASKRPNRAAPSASGATGAASWHRAARAPCAGSRPRWSCRASAWRCSASTRCVTNTSAGEIVTVADVPAQRLNAPAVRVVFAPEASIATINTLLTHQGLSIVSGPGHVGQFHRGAVGRCRGLRRIGGFRRRGDLEGSECHFCTAGCALMHASWPGGSALP